MADLRTDEATTEPRGIDRLRAQRGEERVSFDEIADHLDDFAARYAYAAPVVDQVAAFLARVERIPHGHSAGASGTEAARR